jgi:hypothetical protein
MVRKEGASWDEKTGIRTLTDLDLYEYSFVAIPANTRARVTDIKSASWLLKTAESWTIREFETFLRDSGRFSKEAACTIASRGFKALTDDQRESDTNESQASESLSEFVNELKRMQFLTQVKELSRQCQTS